MLPYFYQFKTHILNEEDCDSLRKLSESNVEKYWGYTSTADRIPNVADNNTILGPNKMQGFRDIVTPNVKKLLTTLSIGGYPAFIRHAPGAEVITHVDDLQNKRLTVLSIPLWPRENYPPTYFRDEKKGPPVATAIFEDNKPCLLNTRVWHDLVNTSDVHRLNFQICFSLPIREVAAMVENNTLWKS